MEEKKDRISNLPDCLIHHILSFLPSTKQAIQTGILSKRWHNQWTRAPVLIFSSSGMAYRNFLKFIDNALVLHDCSKIKKFHLSVYLKYFDGDPQITSKIGFATSKHVEDLNLTLPIHFLYSLPEFVFNNASLVKLRTVGCTFTPSHKVNWGSLTTLSIDHCKLTQQAIEHILSGSPLLEYLELASCYDFGRDKIVIASKSLKKLVLRLRGYYIILLQILCPNLQELSLKNISTKDPKLFDQAIENVLSGCLLLESIELIGCGVFDQLVIASKSLKKLVLVDITDDFDIEISCPLLEDLKFSRRLNLRTVKLLNLSSSICATLDFYRHGGQKTCKSLIIEILQQLQQFKELKIGIWFVEILSTIKMEDQFSPMLNVKCLTMKSPHSIKHNSGIAHLLRISPVLEKLVIHVPPYGKVNHNNIERNYWDSNAAVFECLVSHLKIIKIIGFPDKGSGRREHMYNLVEFLMKNARMLEKMVVIVEDRGRDFELEVSQELLCLQRCSPNVVIELLYSQDVGKFW